jgi:hypothetical protein
VCCAVLRCAALSVPPCALRTTAANLLSMLVTAAIVLAMATASPVQRQHRRQHQHQHQMLHLHTATRGVGRRRSDAAQDILVRTSSSAAWSSARGEHQHRRLISWEAHAALHSATTRCDIHLEPPFRPKPSDHMIACARPSIHLHYHCTPIPSRTHSLLASGRGASHCPAPNHGPSQASASQAHTPRRRLALHTPCLATLVPLTLTRPPSRCTAPHVATLGSRALQIQSPFRQTCLLRLRNTAPTTPSVPILRIPSSPSSHSGSARLHLHQRLLALHFASLNFATPTASRAPLIDLVTAT